MAKSVEAPTAKSIAVTADISVKPQIKTHHAAASVAGSVALTAKSLSPITAPLDMPPKAATASSRASSGPDATPKLAVEAGATWAGSAAPPQAPRTLMTVPKKAKKKTSLRSTKKVADLKKGKRGSRAKVVVITLPDKLVGEDDSEESEPQEVAKPKAKRSKRNRKRKVPNHRRQARKVDRNVAQGVSNVAVT